MQTLVQLNHRGTEYTEKGLENNPSVYSVPLWLTLCSLYNLCFFKLLFNIIIKRAGTWN
jgi:hypothetical protein